jgi:hypothetical protein
MRAILLGVCLWIVGSVASAQTLPSDVRSRHWAAPYVQQALKNGVLAPNEDHNFHGEAKVTRTQAVIALAKLARALESGQWQARPSVALPDKVTRTLEQGDWKQKPVTRYVLAAILARFGDYIKNGLPRPKPGSKDLGKSEALPPRATVTLARTHPAYESLSYLAGNRMLWPNSPLLKPDDKPVPGRDLSTALAQLAVGLSDRMTELGLEPDGSTPDRTFQNKRPNRNPGAPH